MEYKLTATLWNKDILNFSTGKPASAELLEGAIEFIVEHLNSMGLGFMVEQVTDFQDSYTSEEDAISAFNSYSDRIDLGIKINKVFKYEARFIPMWNGRRMLDEFDYLNGSMEFALQNLVLSIKNTYNWYVTHKNTEAWAENIIKKIENFKINAEHPIEQAREFNKYMIDLGEKIEILVAYAPN